MCINIFIYSYLPTARQTAASTEEVSGSCLFSRVSASSYSAVLCLKSKGTRYHVTNLTVSCYMYVCVYMYVFICMYKYMNIRICRYACIDVCVHIYVCV